MKNKDCRLDGIVSLCEKTEVAADIGADHGFTSLKLIQSGKAEKVIVSDVSAPSLKKARTLFERNGLSHRADFRVGDGLSVLRPGEAGGVILTGMGGLLIAGLLKEGMEAAKEAEYLLLSPHSFSEKLREFLITNGFSINTERSVRSGRRYYRLMKAAPGNEEAYSEKEYLLGRSVLKDRTYYESLRLELRDYKEIRQKQGTHQDALLESRIAMIEEELADGNQF